MVAQKSIKREPTAIAVDTDHEPQFAGNHDVPSSSGNTILIENDSDVTMTDDGVPPNPSVGLQVLGKGVKHLVSAVQELRHLGVEDLDLPLPKIVVVGDQSTGKSSLIEGMSEIKVPRSSAGTCTRCPFEINLTGDTSHDAQWSCQVFLHMKYMYLGNPGGRVSGKNGFKEGATRARPLGPWTEQESEDLPFAHVSRKDQVVDVLERAQLAILNPSSPYDKYKPGHPVDRDHQVKFSPNVIRLDIRGPELPNLSFFDLPGVINVPENPDELYLVDLVKNLVRTYIKADDCINLLALTMTHDVANSSAFSLIKEMKAEARTVGCLTKPDNLAKGDSLDQWIQILGGKLFRLGYGYHVIKNNSNPQIDHAVARKEEVAFFNGCEPWMTTLSAYHDRFGTLPLQGTLSHRLTAQIRTSLPRIKNQVQNKAELIHAQIEALPKPLGHNLAVRVIDELNAFERQIEKHLDGGTEELSFQREWQNCAKRFRQALADSKPTIILQPADETMCFRPSTFGTPTPSMRDMPISIESDDEDESPSKRVSKQPLKRQLPFMQSTPNKIARTANGPERLMPAGAGMGKRFDLGEVHSMLQDYLRLPTSEDSRIAERMILLSIAHWGGILNQFLHRIREICEGMIYNLVQEAYGHYSQTEYYETIRAICETFFNKAFDNQSQWLKKLLTLEQSRPMTFDGESLELAERKAHDVLLLKRHEVRASMFLYLDEQEPKNGKASNSQSRLEKLGKVTEAQLGPDRYHQELRVMSKVKGYYECAFSRFVDYVCLSIHFELFSKCRIEIVGEIRKQLCLDEAGADERLRELLAANPEQEQRRTQLHKEMETILKAQGRLESLDEAA